MNGKLPTWKMYRDCFKSHCPAPDLPGGLRRYALFMILSKADLRTLLPSSLCIGTGLFFAVIAALAAIISTNFTKYFIMFHHMFFTNDLWILDPTTDMLINIVPEGFFMDTAGRIAFLFGALSLILFGICLIMTLKNKRR